MPKRSTRTKARTSSDPRDRILDAALALAERKGWRNASLGAIATEAKLPLAAVYGEFRSRAGVLAGLMARIDNTVLASAGAPNAEETPRERLFETLMRRFDAMKPHRAALHSIACDLPRDLPSAVLSAPALLRSMSWMLEASGISSAGVRGRLRTRGLVVIYLCALQTFLSDDSTDLAKTMAALDRKLNQTERWLGMASRMRKGRAAA